MHRHAILYVDDNPTHQELIRGLLERGLDAVVDLVQTASGAQDALNRYCYDLLICDVNLSGELGTTIVERVLEHDPTQPTLILTAYDCDSVLDEIKRIGTPYVDKVTAAGDPAGFTGMVKALVEKRPCAQRDRRLGRAPAEGLQITSPYVHEARAARV